MIRAVPIAGGAPTLVASGAGLSSLITDGEAVYWSDWTADEIVRMPLADGVPAIIPGWTTKPASLEVSDTHVYWVELGDPGPTTVWRIPKLGGERQLVAEGMDWPLRIFLDDDHMYYGPWDAAGVLRGPTQGSVPEIVQSGDLRLGSLHTDGDSLFYTVDRQIVRRSLAGGDPVVLATAPPGRWPTIVGTDAEYVYWNDANGLSCMSKTAAATASVDVEH